jgi:hypothetical protein
MISPSNNKTKQHNGLITYILRQLRLSPNAIFQRYIQDLHIEYQEGKLPKYSPFRLIQDCEDKIRVLRHAEAWINPTTSDTPAMALQSPPTLTEQLKDFLANQISTELQKLIQRGKSTGREGGKDGRTGGDGKTRHRFQHQEWMFQPPSQNSDTKTVNGRTYNWCTKCNRGQGQWVQAHTTATHLDDFIPPNRRQDSARRSNAQRSAQMAQPQDTTDSATKRAHFDPNMTQDKDHQSQTAQLSLSEGLTNCFRFDVQDFLPQDD